MTGYGFDGFRIDPLSRVLFAADGSEIALSGKAFDVLLLLVEQAPRTVGKDELLSSVWAGRVVDENNLTQAVSSIRKALGTGAGDHHFILTEARRGYRFVAKVEREVALPGRTTAPTAGRGRRWALLVGLVVMLGLALASTRQGHEPMSGTSTPPTLAVLPFRAVSGSPAEDMLELGLTDTLIARLSQIDRLRVRSLGSSQQASGASADALAAGRRLQVRYVVEGSTQQEDGRIRVNTRLLEVPGGRALWAGTFDAESGEVFDLQDRIAMAVAVALSLQADLRPARAPSPCDGSDPEAHRAVLTGRHLINRPDALNLPRAIAAFQTAIERDPTCARAYAGLASSYRRQVIGGDFAPRQTIPLAQAATAQALRLDPDLAEAHATHGFLVFWYEWDWERAEAAFRRAVALNPSLPDAHFGYAHLLANLGRFEQGLEHARQARELDPLSPLINTLESAFLAAAGETAEAEAGLQRALDLQPGFWIALLVRGGLALERGDAEAAVNDLTLAVENSRSNSGALAVLGMAQAAAGDRDAALATLQALQARERVGHVPFTSLAAVHVALGQTQQALDELERARDQRDVRLAFLKVDARWNPLRQEPRFRALARELDLESDHGTGRY